jgi:hypothetical protein
MNGETINPVIRVLLGLVVIAIVLYYVLHRSKLESERVEKGERLLELKASMSEIKNFRLDLLSLSVLFLILIGFIILITILSILNLLGGKSIGLGQIVNLFLFPAGFIILWFMKRTYEIYEKGIRIMVRFYPWNTFKGYTIKNGQVLIYFRSFWSGRVVLPDEDGRVEKVIMEYLQKS